MKALFAVRGLFPDFIGGAPRHSYLLIKYLAKRNIEIDVIHPSSNRHFQQYKNVQEISLPPGINAYTYSKNIRQFLKHKTYDVGYSDGFSLWLYLKHREFPCIYNHHGYHFSQPHFLLNQVRYSPVKAVTERCTDWVREFVAWYNIRHADFVVSMSSTITDILVNRYRCPKTKILFSSEAIELHSSCLENTQERIPNSFLFVGSLVYRKGLTYLIEAFNKSRSDSHLYLIGQGPLKGQLVRMADTSKVTFLGQVSERELHSWYGKVEAFVFSGLAEAGPIVILEGMSHFLPIISTDVGAVRDMVDECNGFIVTPGDSEGLRDSIEKFARLSVEQKRSMGMQSRMKLEEKFTWDKVAAQFYQDLVNIVFS